MKKTFFTLSIVLTLISCNDLELTNKYSNMFFEINYPSNWEAIEEEPDTLNSYFQAFLFYDPKIEIPYGTYSGAYIFKLSAFPYDTPNTPSNIAPLWYESMLDKYPKDTEISLSKLGRYDYVLAIDSNKHEWFICDTSIKISIWGDFTKKEGYDIEFGDIEEMLKTLVIKHPNK